MNDGEANLPAPNPWGTVGTRQEDGGSTLPGETPDQGEVGESMELDLSESAEGGSEENESAEASTEVLVGEEPPGDQTDPADLLVGGSVIVLLGASLLPIGDGILSRMGRSGSRIPGAVFFARWGFRHVGIAVSVGILAAIVGQSIALRLDAGFIGLLLSSQLLMVGTAVVAAKQALRLHPEGLDALGLRLKGLSSVAGAAVITYALSFPVIYGVGALWPGLAKLFGVTIGDQEVSHQMTQLGGGALWAGIFLAVVIAPFFEEVVFRGYIQPLLVQNLHAPGGIFVTSLIFASLHGSAFLPILALSMVLGWIHWRTHNTLACVAVHALHNGGMLTLLLLNS
ncbi:MAG: membrane protease YdiL (CAAX protease family) [Planctomycetota bacterium]